MRKLLFVVVIANFVLVEPVHAYIDPGAGSLALQALAALGVGLLFYVRSILKAIKNIFQKKSPDKGDDNSGNG